jgi:hypothetical protein
VDLSGSAESVGDLKSVVLHSLTLSSVSSDFAVPVGVKITGVDNSTYSLTGEAYSTVGKRRPRPARGVRSGS